MDIMKLEEIYLLKEVKKIKKYIDNYPMLRYNKNIGNT